MIIENIETFLLQIPFSTGAENTRLAGADWPTLNTVLIRIDTDAGISGWGDAFGYGAAPATKAAVDHIIAPTLIGQDARDIAGISARLQRDNHLWGRYGITMFAISGIDIALWDIAGKAAGLPLYQLLGGHPDVPLTAYSSLFHYGDTDAVAAKTKEAVANGFHYIKLHEKGIAEIEACREAAGDHVAIMVDTNCPWRYDEALMMAARMAPLGIYWLEEPLFPPEDFNQLAKLQAESGLALAAGENACTAMEFKRMFDAGAVTYAQPSVTKVGGITEFRKVLALAEAYGVQVMPHSPYFGPGFLASLHLATSMSEPCLVEYFDLQAEAWPVGKWSHPIDAQFVAPNGPGLGCDPDPDVITDYSVNNQD